MKRFSLLCFLFLSFSSFTHCFTNEEAIANIHKRASIKYCPFSVTIVSKTIMGTLNQNDSGTVYYSPSGCSLVEMYKSKTVFTGCGDTSWYKMPNGDITRSVQKDDFLEISKNQATMPDFSSAIEKYSGKIVENSGDSSITFEIVIPVEKKDPQKIRLSFDTKKWLLRRVVIGGSPMGNTDAGYSYTEFNGQPMLKEVRMVMGSMGFMVITYSNYLKIKDKKKGFFRLY
jgi:hypothetical protein